MNNDFLVYLAIFGLSIFLGIAYIHASDKQDQLDCYDWQHEAAVSPDFYLTKAQADQCSFWHIAVAAPII